VDSLAQDHAVAGGLVTRTLVDLYCGAGGASKGYHLAGFDRIIGVDKCRQPHYPYGFIEGDALQCLEAMLGGNLQIDAIHASPPCQLFSKAQRIRQRPHPDLLAPTRELLQASGLPYVIENVPGAPLHDPVVLEGQMFPGLRTQRVRLFECSFPVDVPFMRPPPPAAHAKMGRPLRADQWVQVVGNFSDAQAGRDAMGIDWMNRTELAQAIPPAYTEYIGTQLLAYLDQQAVA